MSSFVAAPPGFLLSLKLALRELRGGLSGFRIFVACLALGVASISGVGSISKGLQDGLAREGRSILGGDASFQLVHREATSEEMAFLAARGTVSPVGSMRAMARTQSGNAALGELKAVTDVHPLFGTLETEPALPLPEIVAEKDGVFGAAVDQALLARLDAKVGDRLSVGNITLDVRAALVKEPDNLSGGFGFAPHMYVSRQALDATGLVVPGSLVRWDYRIALPPNAATDADLTKLTTDAKAAFPEAGWRGRTRNSASERLEQNIERFSQFLTLVGLTALLVGGVGVANAVNAYIEKRRETIAVLKCVGASGARVFQIYLVQIFVIAALGIALGLVIGAALPFIVDWAFGAMIPLPFVASLQPLQLMMAAVFGALIALLFALWPLGRAHDLPVSALFRDHLADTKLRWPRRRYLVLTALVLTVLVGLMVFSAAQKLVALVFIGAAAAMFVVLRGVALGIMAIARRLPRPKRTELRIALANIHRPGALTPSVVLSLGLGLALLVTLTLIDSSIRNQLTASLPERAPSFFFADIPNADAPAFISFLKEKAPSSTVEQVPMLRGRVTALKGQSAENYPAGDAAWVLRGDRGITFTDTPPEGSKVVEGEWWQAGYSGENLVSFEADNARELGLKLGDEITVNVLGRDITAKIANLREVEWESLGINFVLVFSPNTFAGAPYQYLATLAFPDGADTATELALLRDTAARFPAILIVRVKDALSSIAEIVTDLALAIRGASGVTLLASVLVLGGALAAGHRYRVYDAMILKVLGASRRRILAAFALEYAMIGVATALFGLAAGAIAAWVVVSQVMDMAFFADVPAAVVAALLALGTTVVLGLAGTFRLVNLKPAPVLRDL
jgi:putative ABC transport system permease protein